MRRTRAFTLVELLAVIGIIAVLIALLLPALNKARAQAQQVVCASNMRQIMLACMTYCAENRNIFPIPYSGYENSAAGPPTRPFQAIYMSDSGTADWNGGTLIRYLGGGAATRQQLFRCPTLGPLPHPVYDGAGNLAFNGNFDYTFNRALADTNGPIGSQRWGVPITRVRHSENKIALMEMVISGDIADDPDEFVGGPDNNWILISKITTRHTGMGNAGWFDGHVERVDPAWFAGDANSTTYMTAAWHHYIDLSSDR